MIFAENNDTYYVNCNTGEIARDILAVVRSDSLPIYCSNLKYTWIIQKTRLAEPRLNSHSLLYISKMDRSYRETLQ